MSEAIENAIAWVKKGKPLDQWLRVNGYTGTEGDKMKEAINTAMVSTRTAAPATKKVVTASPAVKAEEDDESSDADE